MTDILGKLSEAYNDFLTENNLPKISADEFAPEDLTPYQRGWISAFRELWDIQSKQM